MKNKHLFSSSQMFENDHDQNWNNMHTEQPYPNIARDDTMDNGSCMYPVDSMSTERVHFTSHWNSLPRSNGYITSGQSVDAPHFQPNASGPSLDPYLHQSTSVTFRMAPENYGHHASSSNYDRQAWADGGLIDLTMGSGRGAHKRKSPSIPSVCDRGSSSRYYSAGSSSDLPISSEARKDKPYIDSRHMPWDHISMNPAYRSNGLSIRDESSTRNVRSRPAIDLETNLSRTHLSNNPSYRSYSASHLVDHSSSTDHFGQNTGASTREWGSHVRMTPGQGRILVSDTSGFSPETNHFIIGNSAPHTSVEIGGYHHDFISNGNPVVCQNVHSTSAQSMRGVRSSCSQRPSQNFRASSSSLHMEPSDEGLLFVADNYSTRHPRPLSTIAWRSSERNGRSRVSSERYRSLPNGVSLHDRYSSEGPMVVDRAGLYGSRNMFDQHRDMRLDIDNMTYEDLLALGERIGSVNTGLSEDLISKCLTETISCSLDKRQDKEKGHCVICLEEYRDMVDVAVLRTCKHDYHVSCIKKWLLMKNSCPICKSPAVSDMKDK